jgi:hypothetical protein
MSKLTWIVMFATFASVASAADNPLPDLRGTWKGDSESIVLGAGNPHHRPTQANEPELRSVAFTMTVDKQDGRRFSGMFSSPRGTSRIIGVISRSGTILVVDELGYSQGTILGSNRLELCYQHISAGSRIASCVELAKQQ